MVVRWQFDKHKPGKVKLGPPEQGHFRNDNINLSESLVREAIQNSLDAKIEGLENEPVKVNFILKKLKKNKIDKLMERMDSLKPHIEACKFDYPNDEDVYTLTIEDFNTTGLTGSFEIEDDGNYDNFWRSYGEGENKSSTKGGSWGLGKLAYSSSSKLHCFFGMTWREGDSKLSALGQAVLKNHPIGNNKYEPYGFWFDEPFQDGLRLQQPVWDGPEIDFLKDISDAERTNQSGLSVIIPYLSDEIEERTIIPNVISNYYFPILNGELVVDVNGEEINNQTFFNVVDRCIKDKKIPFDDGDIPLTFIKSINDTLKQENHPIKSKPIGNTRLSKEHFDEKQIDTIRSKFADDELLHFRIPVDLNPKTDTNGDKGHIDLFLKATSENEKSHSLFIRGPITLPDERKHFSNAPAHGAMIAYEKNASSFLRDAEGPAHIGWDSQSKKLIERWDLRRNTLLSIRYALRDLYEIIEEKEKDEDTDALIDFFSIMDKSKSTTGPNPDDTEKEKVVIPKSKNPLSIQPRSNGFVLTASENTKKENLEIEEIYVEIAYDTYGGNPFGDFDKCDFDLNDPLPHIEETDAKLKILKPNAISVFPNNSDFRLKVEGFDENRDIVVKAEIVK